MAACSAPLVGILAEGWFGFRGASTITGDRSVDLRNAQALGAALLAFTTSERSCLCLPGCAPPAASHTHASPSAHAPMLPRCVSPAVPWTFCFLMYSGLHLTYPKDRRDALERSRGDGAREWDFEGSGAGARGWRRAVECPVPARVCMSGQGLRLAS